MVGDFNGDGILDLAVANSFSTSVSVLLGFGDGTFAAESRLPWAVIPTRSLSASSTAMEYSTSSTAA